MPQPIRFTAATRRQYTLVTWAVVAALLVCTAGYIVVHHDRASVVSACVGAIVVGGVAFGLLAFDRSNSTYALHGTVLQSRGRRVDLTQVTTAALADRNPKVLGPDARWSTLTLTDAAGGRVRMMITSKRVPHLYEPDDVRTIADTLSRAPLPEAQEVARQLRAFADGANRTLT